MPLYEYICRACGNRFEHMQPVADRLRAPVCPACGKPAATLAMSAPGRVGAAAGAGTGAGTSAGAEPAGGCACGGACGCH